MKTFFRLNYVRLASLILASFSLGLQNQIYAQCNSTVALTVPGNYFGSGFNGNGNFNAIVFGNLHATGGDTEGRLAVAGDFTAPSSYSVGHGSIGAPAPDNTDNFIVNGNFNNANNYSIVGNFIYNTVTAGSQYPTHASGQGTNIGPITNRLAFGTLKTNYVNLSTTLAAITTTGTVVYNDYGNYVDIQLNGTTASTNVFSLTLPTGKTFGLTFNSIPPNSQILVNVTNKIVDINGGSMPDDLRTRMLFNFPLATNISLASYALQAAVLAPSADLSGNGGSINGQAIIGGNVEQTNGFEFHNLCSSFITPTTTPLPVTLTSFSVQKEGIQTSLNWATTAETNSDRFEIQHSVDAKNWNLIGTVIAKGESTVLSNYQFTHSNPANGENYYRLKMIDRDATFAYSRVVEISLDLPSAVSVYPNPVVSQATIETQDWTKVKEVSVINTAGKRFSMSAASGKLDLSNFSSGIYIIQLKQLNGAVSSTKIVKQ
ncbi:choice-of-anchor A family protein [Dyadobacter subterraneus]|uniref:Choice-of-anchor A family protein n=1 Tax=Dyadobacter subterraneus TaxID=2773304 RepID=A0ABR9WGA6_9BACT|nr:choice-of-anchor A family protein [Dyadobacter subterraneus]MBE9464154.1 choice-of-anchor A family protein [Dyadobacter subterraneus]